MTEYIKNNEYSKILTKKYFEENSVLQADIESFNYFIEKGLQQIVDENKEIEPTIIPNNVDEFKIRLEKVWITKPEITEADGSRRPIYPIETRLRKISYSAPIYLEFSSHVNGVQRESFTTQIGNIPIMIKSKFCHLNKMSKDELIKHGEDPDDPGGYFIINGTEKVLIHVEDLASNRILINKQTIGVSKFVGKFFAEVGSFKIPHTIEKLNDGIIYLTFTRVRRIPIIVIIKALGLLKDEEIMNFVSKEKQFDEFFLNLFEFVNIKSEEEALDYIAKKIGITQSKEARVEKIKDLLDRYLLPNIGTSPEDRVFKAYNLCKMIYKFLIVERGEIKVDDKDHYKNKKLKMSGDLLADLFRVNLRVLINDMLYNYQRLVKRGKFPTIKVIIRERLLTSKIYSSMATGNWVGGRKGISQRIQRMNFFDTLSHLQRVVSPLSSSQENFEARALHPTHLGRLCATETPEGTNIGLRKNFALMSSVSSETNEDDVIKALKNLGLKTIEK